MFRTAKLVALLQIHPEQGRITEPFAKWRKRDGVEDARMGPKPDRFAFEHIFGHVRADHQIEHRLTKVKPPRTSGQVERMNRTIKEATVTRCHYDTHAQLKTRLNDFIKAYNSARLLKRLQGLTPYKYICKIWTNEPERFSVNPFRHNVGLNTQYRMTLSYWFRKKDRIREAMQNIEWCPGPDLNRHGR